MPKRRGELALHTYRVGQRVRVVFNLSLRSLGPEAPSRREEDLGIVQGILPDGRYLVGWRKSHAFVREAIELQPDYGDAFAPGDLVEVDLPSGVLPGIVVEVRGYTGWVLLWTELERLPLVWCFAHELNPVQRAELTDTELVPYDRLLKDFGAVRAEHEARRQSSEESHQERERQAHKRRK